MVFRYSSRCREVRWAAILVAGVAGLAFFRGMPAPFVAEDFEWLFSSSLDLGVLLASSLGLRRFDQLILLSARFKPFTLLVNWLAFRLWGAWPIGYHGMSLIAHIVCSVAVLFLGKSLSKSPIVGMIAGLVFAVYPRHHETVLFMAASQTIYCTAFVLLALLSFIVYLLSSKFKYYLTAWICAVGALTSYEVGVFLFPLMFLSELVLDRGSWRTTLKALYCLRMYVKYIPYLLLLILFVGLSFGGQRAFKLESTELDPRMGYETYHFVGVGLDAIKSFVSYWVYLVLPQIPLRSLDVGIGSVVLSLVVVGGSLLLFAFGRAVERFCLFWMGGVLLLFVFFVPFGNADRYFYLPAAGFSLLIGQLAVRLYEWIRKRWKEVARVGGIAIMILYLVSSLVLAQMRIQEWQQAGEVAQDIIEQVVGMHPEVPHCSQIFFVGLPGRSGQAYVFLGGGIGGVMRLAYQDPCLDVYRSVDPKLVQWLASREEAEPTPGQYVFLYEEGKVHDVSAGVRDFEDFYESWLWYR